MPLRPIRACLRDCVSIQLPTPARRRTRQRRCSVFSIRVRIQQLSRRTIQRIHDVQHGLVLEPRIVEIEIVIPGFLEAAEFLVIPQLGELLLDGLAAREFRQIGERQLVFLLHPLLRRRGVGILQSAIWIGDLGAVIIVHLIALGSNRIIEFGSVVSA